MFLSFLLFFDDFEDRWVGFIEVGAEEVLLAFGGDCAVPLLCWSQSLAEDRAFAGSAGEGVEDPGGWF